MKDKQTNYNVINKKGLIVFTILSLISLSVLHAQPGSFSNDPVATSDLGTHDPVMIKQDGIYYLFATGNGVAVASSPDMQNWTREPGVFSETPAWINDTIVPNFRGRHFWAPDVIYRNGLYYVYYSVSAFGRNTSAIGVATNKTLHRDDPNFEWVDHGPVVQSIPGKHAWNAIDPNIVIDDEGTPWMTFGSFWAGMMLVKLNPDMISIAQPEIWHIIAAREVGFNPATNTGAGPGRIEAPHVLKKDGYYYLFVSWDVCCSGLESTYNIRVGRSRDVAGPYLDKEGVDMRQGGGFLVAEGNEDWAAVGHNSAYTFDGKDYVICHGYDAHDEGRSKLIIREINWDNEGWPTIDL